MRICIVASDLEKSNQRLQPWRYLVETACMLAQNGHEIQLLSDGLSRLLKNDFIEGLPVIRLASLQDWPLYPNQQVVKTITNNMPDLVIWHFGLSSFFHLSTLKQIPYPVICIFTSPIYNLHELTQLGTNKLLLGVRFSAVHLLGLLIPDWYIRRTIDKGLINNLVVESRTNNSRLLRKGIPASLVHVIRPGIDISWFTQKQLPHQSVKIRQDIGFSKEDIVVVFFGPPTPLRGLPTLLKAIAKVHTKDPRVKLLILSRQSENEPLHDHFAIQKQMAQLDGHKWAHMATGFLSQEKLIQMISSSDIVALPFELVPSDVPLSVLEAMALGVPVITTRVVCLPEMVPEEAGICIQPSDLNALAEAIQSLAADPELRHKLGNAGRMNALSWSDRDKNNGYWDLLLSQAIG